MPRAATSPVTSRRYRVVDRKALHDFFLSLKHESGGMRMSADGEIDVRATFCVLAIARLFNVLTAELTSGVAECVRLGARWGSHDICLAVASRCRAPSAVIPKE